MTPKQPETARDVALREIVAYLKDVDQACGVLSNRAGWNEEAVRLVYAVLDQGLDQYYPDKSRAYDPVRGYASLLSYLRGYAVVRYDCADEVLREAAAADRRGEAFAADFTLLCGRGGVAARDQHCGTSKDRPKP